MTSRGQVIAQRLAADLEELRKLERAQPAEADAIVCMLVASIRNWHAASLGTLPEPGEPNVDPRRRQ